MKRYEFIEHTADIAVKVFGRTEEELFKNSSFALFKILISYRPKNETTWTIKLKAKTIEQLLVSWLNELNFLFSTCNFLPKEYSLLISQTKSSKILTAILGGQNIDFLINKPNREIKAATYHGLTIIKESNLYTTSIIFDT